MSDDLVSAAELLQSAGRLRLLDVRWTLIGGADRVAYAHGHIPGAVFCDLDAVLAGPPGAGGRHPLPEREQVRAWLAARDLRSDDDVVVYDERDSVAAARAWWVLRWAGYPRVRVLDGGWQAWLAAGGEVASGDGSEPARLPAPEGASDVAVGTRAPDGSGAPDSAAAEPARCGVDEVLTVARAGVLLDARAGERYRGEVEPIDPVGGHIPGAVSAPTMDNLAEDGRFLPAAQLRQRFLDLGVVEGQPVAVYCGSGITAAHEILALRRAGLDAALFPGSWSAWVADASRPVATGPEPGGS